MRPSLPLRLWIPVFLLGMALLASVIVEVNEVRQARANGVQEAILNLRYTLQSKQATLERLLNRGDMTAVKTEVASLRFDENVTDVLLIAPDGRVLVSPSIGAVGLDASEITRHWPGFHLIDMRPTQEAIVHVDSDSQHAHAAYPLVASSDERTMRETISAVLLLNYSLQGIHRKHWLRAWQQFIQTAALLALIALLTSLLLRRLITQRIETLISATERVAAGNFSSAVPERGNDELARLTQAVNTMTASLARQRAALQDNEQRLRASEARLRAIIQAEPECVKLVDHAGSLVEMNQAGLAMIEADSLDQVRGVSVFDLIAPEQRVAFKALHSEVLAGRAAQLDYDIVTLKGNRRAMSTHAVPFTNAEGEVLHLGITADITERRQMHDEQERLRAQLRQAQKMEAIGQLTGGIAHDFNNILGAILGYSGLALDRFGAQMPAKLREYLGQVREASVRARDLIAQMLAFSRGIESKPVCTAMGPLVKEAAKLLRASLPSSMEIEVRVAADLPVVMIDPVQLHQVVMNLCINARDAMMESGSLAIEISRWVRDSSISGTAPVVCASCHRDLAGDYVQLEIRDTGSGIAAEVLPRIFDPFYTTKEVGRGTGMGLSMVHGIVHHFDGHVLVETSPGQGTSFKVLLPSLPAPVTAKHEPAAEVLTAHPANSGTIMLVDDEQALLRFMSELLSSHGYRVKTFSQAAQALQALQAAPELYSLIITDQTMPGMSGLNLARQAHACRSQLAVIIVTGYSTELDPSPVTEPNIRAVLLKPIAPELLLSTIATALSTPATTLPGARNSPG